MSNLPPITSEQARAIDRDASERLCMPTILLMENASRAVADAVRVLGDRCVILCGSGNNGGDGLAAARHLGRDRCLIHLLSEPCATRSPDAHLQLRMLRAASWDIAVGTLPTPEQVGSAVVVDALFGTGLSRPLEGAARHWVEFANRQRGKKLAVDLPSGLHADTGAILGACFEADVTVTFVAPKVGMTVGEGPRCCGRVSVASLSLP